MKISLETLGISPLYVLGLVLTVTLVQKANTDSFSCGPGCKCYTDNRERALVANCSFIGLREVPFNLPNYTNWLFLSGNNIYSLGENVSSLPFLSFLTTVALSQNKLNQISDKIFSLFTHCYSLDISNNNLTTLSENLQNIKSLQSVKISGNPYKCQCENLWIRDWLKESKIANDYLNVTCDFPSGERIYLDDLDDEDLDCSSLSGASSSLWKTLAILVFFLLVATIIIVRKWETIKFCMFVRFGIKFKDKDEMHENLQNMDYDGFVNYTVDDQQWVITKLVEFLESEELGYKLCIHNRDFVPCFTILKNICTAIKHSRRLIAVVTRKYLTSGWCKEEFQLAHLEAVEGRHRFIIFIMVDDLKAKDLPDEMQKFVKSRTYIEAINIENKKDLDLFRKKLQHSMPQTPLRDVPRDDEDNAARHPDFPPLYNRLNKYEIYNKKMKDKGNEQMEQNDEAEV